MAMIYYANPWQQPLLWALSALTEGKFHEKIDSSPDGGSAFCFRI